MHKLALELLRSTWLLSAEGAEAYEALVLDMLAGKEIATGFFSSITLPDVPKNVALVTMAGVLTKADVCNGEGSATLARQVEAAAADQSIDAIIVLSENCPGGQVDGTQRFADSIAAARLVKPVYGAISGMACSAAVWALTQCSMVFATSATDQFGCIGVLANIRTPEGGNAASRYQVVYSDLSPDKNAESRDPKILRQQYLNPVAQLFHEAVKNGRGDRLQLSGKANVLSGLTYVAGDAATHGLIDGIKPFSQIVATALGEAKKQKRTMSNPTNTARFQNLLKTAAAASFAVTDEGFALTEAQMQTVDDALASAATATAAAQQATATATADVTRLTAELATEKATATKAASDLALATAEVTRLKTLDAPGNSTTAPGADAPADDTTSTKDKYWTKYDDEILEQY